MRGIWQPKEMALKLLAAPLSQEAGARPGVTIKTGAKRTRETMLASFIRLKVSENYRAEAIGGARNRQASRRRACNEPDRAVRFILLLMKHKCIARGQCVVASTMASDYHLHWQMSMQEIHRYFAGR